MTFIATIVDLLFGFYILVLLARMVLDIVRMASPEWTPTGIVLVLANLTYELTDPPLRLLRRFIPPIPLGGIALDTAFIVLFFLVTLLRRVVVGLLLGIAL